MEIMFEKCLRDTLVKRGKTQRELAEYLCISTQAVSKWCRGENMPDIALLPKIASFLDVSVDELLGVGEVRKREQIHAYHEESTRYSRAGEVEKRIEVWRRAVGDFPNDHECLVGLMQALVASDDKRYTDEILAIGERVLHESTNDNYRYISMQLLTLTLIGTNKFDEARKYIDKMPNLYVSRELFLSRLYTKMDDAQNGKSVIFYIILTYFDEINKQLYSLCCLNRGDYEHYIKLHEFYIKLADLIFDDGFYGFYNTRIMRRHFWLAKLYTNLHNDEEKARYHIEHAAKCAYDYDNLPHDYVYHGTVIDGNTGCKDNVAKSITETECELLMHHIDGKGLDDEAFDRWRDTDWFRAVVAELEAK